MSSAPAAAQRPEPAPTARAPLGGPPEVLDRLACPECGAPVPGDPGRDGHLQCAAPGGTPHRFPRSDRGVPLLLREDERATLHGDLRTAVTMNRDYRVSLKQRIARIAKRAIGSTLHQPISPTVLEVWKRYEGELALEVGSGVGRGRPGRVNLDIAPFDNVDVVGSALHLPFRDDTFQLVWNAAVLEHVREPARMVAEMRRVLRPGGYVYTEVPFLQHFHAYPNDFQRYTIEGLKQAFADFEVVETGVCVGPSSALTALVADWFELLTFSRNRLVNDIARTIPLVLLWPLKHLDRWLVHHPRAHELASGIYLLARKPGGSGPEKTATAPAVPQGGDGIA